MTPCWRCGACVATVGKRAQGKNGYFAVCLLSAGGCGLKTRDFTTPAAAHETWNADAERKAAMALRALAARIVREATQSLRDDGRFVAIVEGRFIRYGKLDGQKGHGYVLRAPVEGVEREVNPLAFVAWLVPQYPALERLAHPEDLVMRVLADAGLGQAPRAPRTGRHATHARAKGPVIGPVARWADAIVRTTGEAPRGAEAA